MLSRLFLLDRLRLLAADSRGTSVIELALVAPVVGFLFMGMYDFSRGIERQHEIEQAAQRAVEKATVYGSAGTDYSSIDDEAAAAAGVDIQDVTFDQWLECDGVRQSGFHDVCASGEEIARYISVVIDGDYAPYFAYGPLGTAVGVDDNGHFPLSADVSVRVQ